MAPRSLLGACGAVTYDLPGAMSAVSCALCPQFIPGNIRGATYIERWTSLSYQARRSTMSLLYALRVLVLTVFLLRVGAWQTFVVPHSSSPTDDDAPFLRNALAAGNISSDVTILFQTGMTYNIFSPIKFPTLQNVEVAIEGNLSYPADVGTVQGVPLMII